MRPLHNPGIASLLLASILSACGGGDSTAPPTTGTLHFNVVTTGADIDPDGFVVTVDGGLPRPISTHGIFGLSSLPGSHTLTISGLAFNCDVNSAPTSAAVTAGHATQVDVRASCTPYLRDAILYVSEQFGIAEVMVMRADGSRRQRLTTDQVGYIDPVASPDGQSIAVASHVGGGWNGIYLLDRFGKRRTTLVSHSGAGTPAWSPDGTKLAYSGGVPGPYGDYGRIFVVNRDGTGLRQLSPEVAPTDYKYDTHPSWSPDGTRLVFDRMGELFLINADGTGFSSTGVSGVHPAWSPDGTQIAYGDFNLSGIWVMDMSFTPRRLTTAIQQDEWPAWSPDGHQLVFQRVESNIYHLYKIGADGSGATLLGRSAPHNEYAPSWSRNFFAPMSNSPQ